MLRLWAEGAIDFVGGFKFGFEVFAGEAGAEVVDRLGEAVEGVGNVFAVGEAGVAPDVVGAAGEAEHVGEAGPREGERQASFVGFIGDDVGERDGCELREVRDDSYRPVVGFGVGPDRLSADAANERGKFLDSGVGIALGGDESITRAAEQVGVGLVDPRTFLARHRMPTKESRATVEMLLRFAADQRLGASGIGDERVRVRGRGNFRERVDRGPDCQRDINEIGFADGCREVARGVTDCSVRFGGFKHIGAVESNDRKFGKFAPYRERKGSSDQAGSDDGDARKFGFVCHGRSARLEIASEASGEYTREGLFKNTVHAFFLSAIGLIFRCRVRILRTRRETRPYAILAQSLRRDSSNLCS